MRGVFSSGLCLPSSSSLFSLPSAALSSITKSAGIYGVKGQASLCSTSLFLNDFQISERSFPSLLSQTPRRRAPLRRRSPSAPAAFSTSTGPDERASYPSSHQDLSRHFSPYLSSRRYSSLFSFLDPFFLTSPFSPISPNPTKSTRLPSVEVVQGNASFFSFFKSPTRTTSSSASSSSSDSSRLPSSSSSFSFFHRDYHGVGTSSRKTSLSPTLPPVPSPFRCMYTRTSPATASERRCMYTRRHFTTSEGDEKTGTFHSSSSFASPQPLDGLQWSWWELYVKGINPEYPPRQRMFAFLTERGIDVLEMDIREIEDFTKWLEMRRVYGEKFPRFPYDLTLDDKIDVLKEKYPLQKDRQD